MHSHTSAGSPLAVTIDPASVKVPSGYGVYHGHTVVVNDGHAAITVQPAIIRLSTGHTACSQGPPSWLTASTKSFKLGPGQEHTVNYTVHAASHANGSAALLLTAAGPKTAAGQTAGALGMRATLGTGVNTTACTKPISLAAPHAASGPPMVLLILVAVLAVALVAGLIVVGRKIHNRRAA